MVAHDSNCNRGGDAIMLITMETAGESTSLLMVAHGNDTSINREGREGTKPMIVAQVGDPSILTNFKVHSNQ